VEISGYILRSKKPNPLFGLRNPDRRRAGWSCRVIPLAEAIGLIGPLGEWVLRRACSEAARWPGDLKIAVNLSPAQFRTPQRSPGGLERARLFGPAAPSARAGDYRIETEANLTILHQLRDLAERPDCMAIIRAVTGLGASLGISTTAEGVETRAQLDGLRAEGCTKAQGFLLSRPRPSADIMSLLAIEKDRAKVA
jgi:EAL domain-containing protein (putative c-di-GMP-specific phosphodiesterase class I)